MRAPADLTTPSPVRLSAAPNIHTPTVTPDLDTPTLVRDLHRPAVTRDLPPTPPVPHQAQSAAATATATAPIPTNEHADAAYRDLLTRVREEREQLGLLISHPF
jgi:hypothetical protein